MNECANVAEQAINTLTEIDANKEIMAEETIRERIN
jgi:hypothetical protein